MSGSVPIDKALYSKVKQEAKRKFLVYPSIYANSWLVREYKKRGGRYKTERSVKRSPRRSVRKSFGLQKWYAENWVNVCSLPKKVPCGRSKSSMKKYPYCRPSKRVDETTPLTIHEIPRKELMKRCRSKRRNSIRKVQ